MGRLGARSGVADAVVRLTSGLMDGGVCADRAGMSYGELQSVRGQELETPDAPWGRADACDEVVRAAAVLARELSDLLGWKVKVEVTARLGGQIASAAVRAFPPED